MGPRIAKYSAERDSGKHEARVLIDVRSLHIWFSVVATILGIFISAAGGLWAAAHKVVPPIALEAVKPELEKIREEHKEMRSELQRADQTNLQEVRQEMRDLRQSLENADGTMKQLLLQLAAQGGTKALR